MAWPYQNKNGRRWHWKRDDRVFVNDQIRAPRMLLIAEDGSKMGTMPRHKVLAMWEAQGKDVIQLHYDFNEKIATVKLVDFGKYMYEKQKAAKEQKKNSKQQSMKQMKFRYSIGDNDFALKMKKIKEMLLEWHPVRVSVRLRGRERIFSDRIIEKLRFMYQELQDIAKCPSGWPKNEGTGYLLVLFPKGR